MNKAEILNKQYLQLCQQLGDAHFKLKQLNAHIASLESQIDTLNNCYPILAKADAAAAAEQKTSAAVATDVSKES